MPTDFQDGNSNNNVFSYLRPREMGYGFFIIICVTSVKDMFRSN